MSKFYTLYTQTLDISEEIKQKEVEDFIMKYHLDYKIGSEALKSKPIWQFFLIFVIVNTIIGTWNIFNEGWTYNDLLYGYGIIAFLYIVTYIAAMFQDHNIKVS